MEFPDNPDTLPGQHSRRDRLESIPLPHADTNATPVQSLSSPRRKRAFRALQPKGSPIKVRPAVQMGPMDG